MNYREKMKASVDYIEEHLDERIKLEDLAKKAYFSAYYFHRLFHRIVGEPVMEYIRKRRLSRAAADLTGSNKKILEIALQYQFGSQESFARAFKASFGVSPREYRRNGGFVPQYGKASICGSKPPVPAGPSSKVRMAA